MAAAATILRLRHATFWQQFQKSRKNVGLRGNFRRFREFRQSFVSLLKGEYKMRKFAIAMALASTAMASPALARDNAWYVGVDGGVMLVEDMDLDIESAVGSDSLVNNAASVDYDKGYDFGGVVGYDFGAFRLEAEASYRRAGADAITAGTPGIGAGANGDAATYSGDANGHVSALSMMVNGLIDFGEDDGLQGSIGAGAGIARVDVKNIVAEPYWLHDSDTGFAWQALAQVRAPISDNWDVGLKYRFFNAPNVDLVDQYGRDVETKFRSHSLMGSLIYNFGEPAAPPPPPPVETPPPPPPVETPPVVEAPVCQPGPYIVFFDWDKSDITSEAAATLDNAVSAYNNGCTGTTVMLAGNADRSGNASYNVGLSSRRNASVQSYMSSRGIPDSAFTSEAFGESRPRVDTADGVREPQNRNVQIMYGPGAGT